MEITFKDRKLERIINDPRKLKKRFNQAAVKVLKSIEILEQHDNLGQISVKPPIRRHLLSGDLKGNYAIDVTIKLRLVFEINHDSIPKLPDNSVDLDNVTKICIIDICDYH